jgi:hypothetical protein
LTAAAPIVPVAPALLSTMNDWPKVLLSDGPMARAMASVEPPGGNGTTRVTGLAGQACACAAETVANARTRVVKNFFMGCLRGNRCCRRAGRRSSGARAKTDA